MAEFYSGPKISADPSAPPWYRLLTGYHWFVLLVASLGWMFDCLDQQLFILARMPAMRELLAGTGRDPNQWGTIATSVFLVVTVYNDVRSYVEGTSPLINSVFGLFLVALGSPFYYYFRSSRAES